MNDVSKTIAGGMIQFFQDFNGRVRTMAAPLTEEQFWTNPYGYGNSFGNLVLHLTGNLNHFIGAQIARTGYVREREREFADRLVGRKEQVLQRLDEAIAMVIETLGRQTDEDWGREYSVAGMPALRDRYSAFLMCTAHFHHHIGQMIYLSKELAKSE
jgi:hypothetical protein